ncbi:MAG: hypothetical protein ABFD89_06635 [Bryobacteraceae bacterium]
MAGTLQYLGDATLKFKDFDVRSGPKGSTTHFRVHSPSLAALTNYHNYILTYGASVTFRGCDGGEDRSLDVELPGMSSVTAGVLSELFFDQWELLTNEATDTIFANPLIVGGVSPVLDYNGKTVLSKLALNGGSLVNAVNRCNADLVSAGGNLTAPTVGNGGTADGKFQAPSSAAAKQLTLEILKGQTEYMKPTYVLRHTSYCSAGATYNANVAGSMLIYSTAQLLSEVSRGWTYNLPQRLNSKVAAIPYQSAPGEEASYYTWGWLKKITREPVLANFMVEVSSEYELALWSNLRYWLR